MHTRRRKKIFSRAPGFTRGVGVTDLRLTVHKTRALFPRPFPRRRGTKPYLQCVFVRIGRERSGATEAGWGGKYLRLRHEGASERAIYVENVLFLVPRRLRDSRFAPPE